MSNVARAAFPFARPQGPHHQLRHSHTPLLQVMTPQGAAPNTPSQPTTPPSSSAGPTSRPHIPSRSAMLSKKSQAESAAPYLTKAT